MTEALQKILATAIRRAIAGAQKAGTEAEVDTPFCHPSAYGAIKGDLWGLMDGLSRDDVAFVLACRQAAKQGDGASAFDILRNWQARGIA